jgi:Ca2+-binding EF-hand superfamily protein
VFPYIADISQPEDLRREVFGYYGTFWRAMITMFEITFANWGPLCRLLIDNISEWFGVFFLIYRCVVGFAMLSVIQAVFIQQTMKSAQLDDDFVIQQKHREKEAYAAKLLKIFRKLDTSGDGLISRQEFSHLLESKDIRLLMSTLDVDVRDMDTARDLDALFKLIDDGDGRISPEEFVNGLQRMKGNARALDLVKLTKITKRIEKCLSVAGFASTTPFLKDLKSDKTYASDRTDVSIFD